MALNHADQAVSSGRMHDADSKMHAMEIRGGPGSATSLVCVLLSSHSEKHAPKMRGLHEGQNLTGGGWAHPSPCKIKAAQKKGLG